MIKLETNQICKKGWFFAFFLLPKTSKIQKPMGKPQATSPLSDVGCILAFMFGFKMWREEVEEIGTESGGLGLDVFAKIDVVWVVLEISEREGFEVLKDMEEWSKHFEFLY